MKARLGRPRIFFPYKSLKSKIVITSEKFSAKTFKLQKITNFGILFHVMQMVSSVRVVYDKNKDTHLRIWCMQENNNTTHNSLLMCHQL